MEALTGVDRGNQLAHFAAEGRRAEARWTTGGWPRRRLLHIDRMKLTVALLLGMIPLRLLAAQPAPSSAGVEEVPSLIRAAAAYESGRSMEPLRRLEELARASAADAPLRGALEAGLVALLATNATEEAQQFAIQQLSTVGSEASLPALSELLRNTNTVTLACQALSTHPSPGASAILREALPSLSSPARVQVISLLGSRQDPAAVPALILWSRDPEVETAAAALVALGKIATAPARDAIAALGEPDDPRLARARFEASMTAAERMVAEGEPQAAQVIYQDLIRPGRPDNIRRGAFEALLQLEGGEERLLEVLGGTDALLKPVAIANARRFRSEQSSARFARRLPGLPAPEQVWLIQVLAGRGDAPAREAVANSLASSNATVRLAAIEALGRAGGVEAAPLLLERLASGTTSQERAAVMKALAGLSGGSGVDECLLQAFPRSSEAVQTSLLGVLARRGSRAALPAILEAVEVPALAEAALEACGQLAGPQDVPALLNKLAHLRVPAARSTAEAAATQALARLERPEQRADAVLAALAAAPDASARSSLIRLLPLCEDPRALAAVNTARRDPHPEVRDAAVRALTEWPDSRAWDALLETCRGADSEPHRVLALRAMVRLAEGGNERPDAHLLGRYRTLLAEARTDEDRKLILGALGGVAHPEARALILPLLSNEAVRPEAELALQRISAALP